MKKIVYLLVLSVFLGNLTSSAFAQTSSTTASQLQALIESLKQQIAALQTKVGAQKQATVAVREAAQDVRDTLILIRQLRQGMSGSEIKALQAILAADPEIYPEGKITGFFGTLTANAVKRFQKKHGLEQVGNVGPKTLSLLKKEMEKNQLLEEDDDSKDEDHDGKTDKRLCAIVPPGHLIAPGWLKKNAPPIVPACQVLPYGIAVKLGLATSTSSSTDNFAPVISAVSATGMTSSSVTINWNTNEMSDSAVWYSTSSPVSATGTTPMVSSAAFVTSHSIALTGLTAGTTYHYVLVSRDAAGNKASSGEFTFQTSVLGDVTAPVISGVVIASTTHNSAVILWNTDEAADSTVWYSTTSPVSASGSTPNASSTALVTSHNIVLSGLNVSTTYHFVVVSKDAVGNAATSAEYPFTTLPLPDTTAPTISGVSAMNIASSSAHIVWTTNENADSLVWYSTSSPVIAASTTPNVNSVSFVTSHDLMLSDLVASTTYYYKISSKDVASNSTTSDEFSFVTVGE